MAGIELLEQRVDELEDRVYGLKDKPSLDDALPESSMVDSLIHVNTLINSALSGREKTNNLVKRLPELNEMLDPAYDAIDIHSEAKLELVLAMEPEIREQVESIDRLIELKPALELNSISNVSELTPKLGALTLSYLETHEEAEGLSRNIWAVFSEYNNIVTSIAKTLIGLEAAVTAAEIAATPVKQLD